MIIGATGMLPSSTITTSRASRAKFCRRICRRASTAYPLRLYVSSITDARMPASARAAAAFIAELVSSHRAGLASVLAAASTDRMSVPSSVTFGFVSMIS